MDTVARVEVLGGFRLWIGMECVSAKVSSPKARLLITYLAYYGTTSRERLAASLWPHADPLDARHCLKQTVARVRRDLGEAQVTFLPRSSQRDLLALSPAVTCDALEWETRSQQFTRLLVRAERAEPSCDVHQHVESAARDLLATYGELLPGCDGDWLSQLRHHFAEYQRLARTYLISRWTARGDNASALDLLRVMHGQNPHDKATADQYHRLLDACGLADAVRRIQPKTALPATPPSLPTTPAIGTRADPVRPPLQALGTTSSNVVRCSIEWAERLQHAAHPEQAASRASLWAEVDREHDELNTFLTRLTAEHPQKALRLAVDAYLFWYERGHFGVGRRFLENLLPQTRDADVKTRADALLAAGHLANCQGDNRAAFVRYRAATHLYRTLGDEDGLAWAAMREGNAAMEVGHRYAAHPLCHAAAEHFRRCGDEPALLTALFYRQQTAGEIGDIETSARDFADSLSLARSLHNPRFHSLLCYNDAQVQVDHGAWRNAADLLTQAFEMQVRQREPFVIIYALRPLISLLASRKQLSEAAQVIGMIQGLRERHHFPLTLLEARNPLRYFHSSARSLLHPHTQRDAREEGICRAADLDRVLAFAREWCAF